ncbi:MAG TPA: hypothetical protein VE398_24365, partial [Acidobacteriota bacterium]|nr:hypothetical protein [Acidobacteriota bacterium]
MIGKGATSGPPSPEAARLASGFEQRFLKETGANVSARLAVSLMNREAPGFFLAQFDKGRRRRFTCLIDFQGRIPEANFGIDGGEKGLIFTHRSDSSSNDVWMAFYSAEDYSRGRVTYSDAFNLVKTTHYSMDVDLREPKKLLRLNLLMEMENLGSPVRAIPFSLSEDLDESDNLRLKKAMRVKSARLAGSAPLEFAQEDWEGGVTIFMPADVAAGQKLAVEMQAEGDFMRDVDFAPATNYPLSNTTWYPRHGSLGRSTFDLRFHHRKKLSVSSAGIRIREEADPSATDGLLTQFKIDAPVALVTFAIGPFERHSDSLKRKDGP